MSQDRISIDELRSAARRLPNESLAAIREAAMEHLDRHGLPTTRHEDRVAGWMRYGPLTRGTTRLTSSASCSVVSIGCR